MAVITSNAITGISNTIEEDGLKISNAGSNGQYLQKQSGDTGGLTWATVTTTPADDSITLAKMAHGTDGNLNTYDANGAPAYVTTGNDGQVLTSTGAGSAPAFEALPALGKVINSWGLTTNSSTSVSDSSTWTDTELTITLTPASTNSKFIIAVSQAIYIQDSSSTEAKGGWRFMRGTQVLTGDNGEVIYMQAAGTGHIQAHHHPAFTLRDAPETTSSITYHTEIMSVQDNITSGGNRGSSMFILELSS